MTQAPATANAGGSMSPLVQFRKRYPQYGDLSDRELADSIHSRFYADMPKPEFYGRIGFSPEAEAPKPPAAPPLETDTTGPARRALQLGTQATARGMADVVGAPVDIVSAGINAVSSLAERGANAVLPDEYGVSLPRVTDPVLGSDWIFGKFKDHVADPAGFPVRDPQDLNFKERTRYSMQRFGVPGPAVGALVRKGPALAGGAKELAADMLGGMGAGSAVSALEETGYDGPLANLFATLLGSIVGSKTIDVASAPKRTVNAVARRVAPAHEVPLDSVTGKRPSKSTTDQAARVLQQHAVDPNSAALRIGERMQENADAGVRNPTSGLMSNDEGVVSLENTFRRRPDYMPRPNGSGDVTTHGQYIRRDRQVADDASGLIASVRPQDAEPRKATEFAARQRMQILDKAQGDLRRAKDASALAGEAEQATGARVNSYRGGADAASESLDRIVVDDTLEPRRAAKNQRFGEIDPAGTVERDTTPITDAVAEARRSVSPLVPHEEALPENWLRKIEATAASGEPISFKDINDMRPHLSAAIRKAQREGSYGLADSLRRLKRSVESEVDRLAAEGGDAGENAREALRYYREEYAPFFAQGAGGKLRRAIDADDPARSNTPPTQTASMFLRVGGGSKEVASDLRRIIEIAPDPAAGKDAVRRYLLHDMAKTVDADGTVKPAALREWTANRAGVLDQFPEFRDEVKALQRDVMEGRQRSARLSAELDRARANLKRTQREIQNSAFIAIADYEPTKAARQAFNAKDPQKAVAEITDRVKADPDAARGWKAAVADYVRELATKTNTTATESGARNPSLAEINNLFEKHRGTLAKVFSPKEMNALQVAHKEVEDLARKTLSASAGSTTTEELAKVLTAVEVPLRFMYGHLRTGGIMRSIRLSMNTVPGLDSQRKVAQLLNRSMFDGELAAHLLTRPTDRAPLTKWNKRLATLMGLAEAGRKSQEELRKENAANVSK